MFGVFWASPAPGVAGNGFSAKNDSEFRGRHPNPCPGDPFRGHFSFLKVTPNKWQKSMFMWFVFSRVTPPPPPYKKNPDIRLPKLMDY